MIKLYYSNDVQYLGRLLAHNLDQERPQGPDGVFWSARVVVPNPNVETYLKYEIAKATGIVAHIKFSFLNDYLSRLASSDQGKRTLLDQRLIHFLLIQHMLENRGSSDTLPSEVASYINTPGAESAVSDRWVFQLADRLARYFKEYTLSRSGMLESWMKKKLFTRDGSSGIPRIEAWQRQIWLSLFGTGGAIEALSRETGNQYFTFDRIGQLISKSSFDLPKKIHLFGFSYVSRTHNAILERLGERTDLSIYTVNPCMEFWEDVLTPAESLALKQRYIARENRAKREHDDQEDPYNLLDDSTENPFLQHWGRPGRENIHILNTMTSCDFYSGFIDPLERGHSLLRMIQHDILVRKTDNSARPERYSLQNDCSIRILECPEIRREVEIIANEIWDLIREDSRVNAQNPSEKLRFNDIAVIIANASEFSTYTTHITSVFLDIYDIPHTISDMTPDSSSIIEAINHLISLPLKPVNRAELLGLITHPAFQNRFPETDFEEWAAWFEDLAIYHGVNRKDHEGTYIEKDLFNVDQGLRRLVLGAFLEGARSGEKRPFHGEDTGMDYLPQDIAQGSVANAGKFILLLRSLLADREFATTSSLTMSEWAVFIQTFVTSYLKPETLEDERTLARCLDEISSLGQIDVRNKPVSYVIAREFAASAIQTVALARGRYLSRGVVVSSFLPMRPLPFKVVFIAGMGEGLFPAREMRDPLDLRSAGRQAGDVTPRERDQYNFLETMISTRDRLYLSYVSRDSQTGESLEPSSVIKELSFILEQRYLTDRELASITIRHPLRRYDNRYFPEILGTVEQPLSNHSQAARREAQTIRLKQDLLRTLNERGIAVDEQMIEQFGRDRLGPFLYPFTPTGHVQEQKSETIRVPLYALRKFLECPLQGWASYQLGLEEEDDEDIRVIVDEAFVTDRLVAGATKRTAFMGSLGTADPSKEADRSYAESMAYSELKGTSPTGFFLDIEKNKHRADLQAWGTNYSLLGLPVETAWKTVRLGMAGEHADVDVQLPPLCFQIEQPGNAANSPLNVELSGTLGYLTDDLTRHLYPGTRRGDVDPKDFLSGFLSYLVLLASGNLPVPALTASVLAAQSSDKNIEEKNVKKFTRSVLFKDSTREQAQDYLKQIVSDMLFVPHAYLLPIEAVVKSRWNSRGMSISEHIEVLKESGKGYSSLYGPVSHPEDHAPPEEQEIQKIVERRYGLFLSVMPSEW